MKYAIVSIVVIATCGFAGPADSRELAPVNLSALLDEVERASPQLLAQRARTEAAANIATQRETLPDPKLSFVYTNDGLSEFTLGSSEFANLTIGWEQEVPHRAVRGRDADLARAQTETLRVSTETLRAKLRARVIALYAELWRLDQTRGLLDENHTLLTAVVEVAQARYESGEGIQESLIRAQGAVRRSDLELEELALMRRQTEIALGAAVGRAEDPTFGPAETLPAATGPFDPDASTRIAVATSPEVTEAAAREREASARLEAARVQVKPEYSWVAAYQFRGGLDPMVAGGFSVRLPVWKDRKQQQAIASATLEQTAVAHDREDAELRARAATRELAADIDSIDIRLRLYRDAIVPQALAAFESARAAFASGRAEMLLVLDDLGLWVSARREAVALSARRVETLAALEAATGTTLFESLGSGRPQ